MYRRTIIVNYPLGSGRIALRTENDWNTDVEAVATGPDGSSWSFEVQSERPWLYFKPVIRVGDTLVWARGANRLTVLTGSGPDAHYPYFFASSAGTFAPLFTLDSSLLGRQHKARVYLPPGYEENYLKRYPVIYMQDGRNLFFPQEAFLGRDWMVDETVAALDAMNLIDKVIVVGVYSSNREHDYTGAGYEVYGHALVDELKPAIDAAFRTLDDRMNTAVMGSSLGGVVSFHLAWQWPQVFSAAACLSGTFGWRDDLLDRVLTEPSRDVRIYLDSGWPEDNYETTLSVAMALISRGWVLGRNLVHLVFPGARHDEPSWTARLPLPLQFFRGKVRNAWRARQQATGDESQ